MSSFLCSSETLSLVAPARIKRPQFIHWILKTIKQCVPFVRLVMMRDVGIAQCRAARMYAC